MKNKLSKISVSLLLALQLNAVETYSIDDLVLKAMQNSPDLKIATSSIEASKSRTAIASSSYLPTIDLHLSAGKNGISNIPTDPDSMISDTLLLGSLSLKQIVYNFGKTSNNVDSFKYDSDAFSMNNLQLISDKKRDVKLAYYSVLQAKALIDVQKENVKLNRSQLYRSKKYFQAGIRTKIDISDAKVELIKAKLDLKKAQYSLKTAFALLDRVVGFEKSVNVYDIYKGKLDLTQLYSSLKEYPLNLPESIDFSYKNRYELKRQSFDILSAKSQNKLASSNYYPELYFKADYTKQSVDKFKSSIPKDKWQGSLNLNWNLYKGGATEHSKQEKKVQLEIENSKYLSSKLLIKNETTEAFINVYKAKDSVELSQSLVEVSDEKFNQASKRYEHGLSDYIELQQSRQGYIDSKAYLIINYYSYYQAIAKLDNAIGK